MTMLFIIQRKNSQCIRPCSGRWGRCEICSLSDQKASPLRRYGCTTGLLAGPGQIMIGSERFFRLLSMKIRVEGYYFQPYQEISENNVDQTAVLEPVLSDRALIGTADLVYNSLIGPISLGVNYYDKKAEHVSLNLNIGYILFNRKALP